GAGRAVQALHLLPRRLRQGRRGLLPRLARQALPSPKALDSRSLPRVDDIRAGSRDDAPLDVCSRAVRAMKRVSGAPRCAALAPEVSAAISRWTAVGPPGDDA